MNRHIAAARAPRGLDHPADFVTEVDRVAPYLEDAAHVPGGHARAVVVPADERQVAGVLRSSAPVLAVGAQSSLTGGATPRGETVLSTARLRTLIDLDDGRVRVGAGVTVGEVDDHVRRRGAAYPPLPTWTGATVGGTIATNAAGAATFKYGTTRDWVDAITVVLASGDVLDLERGNVVAHPDGYFDLDLAGGIVRVPVPDYRIPRVPKVSAGFCAGPGLDLVDLFIGAEGTLGVVTEATLRIEKERRAICLAFLTTRDRRAALALVRALREQAQDTWRTRSRDGLDVAAIEHMDARSLMLLREDGVDRRLGVTLDPEANTGLLLTIELQDDGGEALERLMETIEAHAPGEDVLVALPGDDSGAKRLLALREGVPLAVNQRIARAQRDIDSRIEKMAADVIVPFERLGELLEGCDAEAGRRQLDLAVWGHISDGNLHPNVIVRNGSELDAAREAVLAFGREAIRLGGAPMAEHGVGRNRIKQTLLAELYGPAGVEAMRAVKRALDPEGRLAPGVLFQQVG